MNSTGGLVAGTCEVPAVAPVWVTTLVVGRGATSCNSPNHPPRTTPRGPTTIYSKQMRAALPAVLLLRYCWRWWLFLPTNYTPNAGGCPSFHLLTQCGWLVSLWWLIPLGGSAQRRRQRKRSAWRQRGRRRSATAKAEPAAVRTRS